MEERFCLDSLPNGVRVLTEEIPHVLSAAVGIWVSVGSMHETQEVAGICHALEHMLFKGTPSRSAREIAETLDAVGGQLNAFTDKEVTCFHAHVLSEHLPLALDLLCDMLRNSCFRPADVRLEKRVILEEIGQIEDEPDELVHDLLMERMWPDHPLGRPVIGTRRTVRALNRETLVGFLHENYVAGRVVVATAGAVSHTRIVEQMERLLGGMRAAPVPADPPAPQTQCSTRRVGRETEQAHICLGVPGTSQLDPDRYPLAVLDTLLGSANSSRLFQEIRESRGLAYTVGSCSVSYRDAGVLTVYAGTRPDTADAVLTLIREEFDRVLQEGVRADEVERARSQLKGSLLLALEGTGSRMVRIAKSLLYYGRVLPMDEVVHDIDSVTLEDVNRIARTILPAAGTSVVVLGPKAKPARRRG